MSDKNVSDMTDDEMRALAGVTMDAAIRDNEASPEQMLRTFHESKVIHNGLMPDFPTADIPEWVRDLRMRLLDEEVEELREAIAEGDIVKIADALGDIEHVTRGTAVTYGIPSDAVFAEIFRSNMTKDNSPAEGKLVKGPGYVPPRIAEILTRHGAAGLSTALDCGCEVRLSDIACWYHDELEYGAAYPGCKDCRFGVPPAVHRREKGTAS